MDSLSFLLPFALALFATGLVAGTLAGLLGVGGGIVIVPVLFLLFPLLDVAPAVHMHLAVGTSLATIIPTSIMSARAHHKRGGLDVSLLRSLAPAMVLGVIVGSVLGGALSGIALTAIFAVVALIVSIHMGFGQMGVLTADHRVAEGLPTGWPRWLIGFGIGGFSVLMGIGGGTLGVPTLTLFGVPIRRAVGTAAAFGLIISVPGAIGFILGGLGAANLPPFSIGYANLLGFALIVPATMIAAPFGAKIAHTIRPALLRRAFAFFLFLTALRMVYGVVTAA